MSCSRTQHGGGRSFSLRSPTLYHWATALPKALGPDELHPRVLKELATELGPVFAHLFQQSLDMGEIPKEWSLANICPLYKKGDRAPACKYHPVSLTCVPCKFLEHSVLEHMAHLDEYNLSDKQHAFRKRHSCEMQLTSVNQRTIGPVSHTWLLRIC